MHHESLAPGATRTIRRADVALLSALVGIVALIGVFAQEHIGAYGGYGWDGITYREILANPAAQVIGKRVDSYTLQRVVPNFVVGSAMRAVGIEQSGRTVARAFGLYNAALLVLCAVLWGTAARQLALSRRAFWLGATALFLSFASTKQVAYYPVLTDTTAYTLSLALLVAFLARSTVGVAAIALLGAFTWPVALPLAIPLLLWPRGVAPVEPTRSRWIAALVAGGITSGILAIFGYLHWVNGRFSAGKGPVIPVIPDLVPLSMFLFALMAFGSLYLLLRGIDLRWIWTLIRSLRPGRTLLAIAIIAVVLGTIRQLAAPNVVPPLPLRTFLGMLAITPIARPLVNVVAHATYYGPWVLILVAMWPLAARLIQREGAGLVAFACGATILAFLPESRQAIFSVPLFALYFAAASDRLAFTRPALAIYLLASVLATRVWVHYGTADTYAFTVYRRYIATNGPYMPTRDYVVYGAACVVVAVLLFVAVRRSTSQTRAVAP